MQLKEIYQIQQENLFNKSLSKFQHNVSQENYNKSQQLQAAKNRLRLESTERNRQEIQQSFDSYE